MWKRSSLFAFIAIASVTTTGSAYDFTPVGAAKIDITPDYPLRMTGYRSRKTEATEVSQRIWARALVIGSDEGSGPALLITVENCGMTPAIRGAVVKALKEKAGVKNERIAVSVTHSHTAPMLKNWAPFIFGEDLPKDQQERIDRYTGELIEKMIEVALSALKAREPAQLFWGQGSVGIAGNRRVLQDGVWRGFGIQADGPVDHSLPILVAKNKDDKVVAIVANYACHCTTLGGNFNKIHGDWVSYAQQFIEEDNPGAVALITIGTGADANPNPRGEEPMCRQHGRALADEVKKLLTGELKPVDPSLNCRLINVELPFGKLPTKEQLQEEAKRNDPIGYRAKQFLKRIEGGEALPQSLSYPVGTWTFGDDLAMVFLGGEVVVDYGILLKEAFDAERLWITAYANDVPCYIPSKRILREGGYEADFSMVYYARPTRFAPEVEDVIVDTVQKLLPPKFYSKDKQSHFPPAMSPEESLAAIELRAGMKVELVAAEPLVVDPVAFDWGPDGRLWVVEMSDYPNGIGWDGDPNKLGDPGGRIKVLDDDDGDGRYDRATVFLDNLAFPTGVKVWRDGILVTAAPEILYAEDTDGDDRADVRKTLYKGFGEGNQQHRVNGLRWGLDNWLYVGNGDSNGKIRSMKTGKEVDISGRDLRIRPDDGSLEAIAGRTQFGRCTDGRGNWFGGNNSNPIWHYVLDEHYQKRNPHFVSPDAKKQISVEPGAAPVFPASQTLARFNDFNKVDRFTSACSPTIYRDNFLDHRHRGEERPSTYTLDAFVCEPVHNLVSRLVVQRDGVSFKARRAKDEQASEFFASRDNWCRPVMVRTGPDGALWISDMYRFVIEHPKWIPTQWQQKLDLRAGRDKGRIYRVFPSDKTPRPFHRLDTLETEELVDELDNSNGWIRDMAHQMLIWRNDPNAVSFLEKLALSSNSFGGAEHALNVLAGMNRLTPSLMVQVKRPSIRLAARFINEEKELGHKIHSMTNASPPQIQLAYTLGEWRDPMAAKALGQLANDHRDNSYFMAAVYSSLNDDNIVPFIERLLDSKLDDPPIEVLGQALAIAASYKQAEITNAAINCVAEELQSHEQILVFASFLDLFRYDRSRIFSVLDKKTNDTLVAVFKQANEVANEQGTKQQIRVAAIKLLGARPKLTADDTENFVELLNPRNPPEIQNAALETLKLSAGDEFSRLVLAGWRSHLPKIRASIVTTLLQRTGWTKDLLTAIEKGQIPPSRITAVHRQQLSKHRDEAIREQYVRLFANSIESDRSKVVTAYADVAKLKGHAEQGAAVFKKHCSKCHEHAGQGKALGPNLTALTNKSPMFLLTSMLDPNRAVEDKYLSYTVVTTDGRQFSGMISSETSNGITLSGADEKTHVIVRSQIEELVETGKSFMPEGIERDASRQDLADVIAFVSELGSAPKQFPGNEPKVSFVRDDGSIRLLATDCKIYGPTLVFEPKYRNLGYWQSEADRAVWSLNVRDAGRYRMSLDYACDDGASGDRYQLVIAGQTLGGVVDGSGSWNDYRSTTVGEVTLDSGLNELLFRSDGPISSALIDLRTIRLQPIEKD